MRKPISCVSLAGASFAMVLHVLAIFGYTPLEGMAAAVFLFLVAVPGWLALMVHVSASARVGGTRASPPDWSATMPVWGRKVFVAVFMYACVNFAAFLAATGGGGVEKRADGRYVLSEHGRVIRELDLNGVHAIHAWEVRLFSGHLLPFLLLPGLYLFFARSGDKLARKPLPPAA